MESTNAVYKLTILYMLDKAGQGVDVPRISGFLLESGYVNFEALATVLSQVEEDGLVETYETGGKTFMKITDEGEQILKYMSNDLGSGIRGQVDAYLKQIGKYLRKDRDITAEYFRNPRDRAGSFLAHMSVREEGLTILDLTVGAPDEMTARQIADNWKDACSDLYAQILNRLLAAPSEGKDGER